MHIFQYIIGINIHNGPKFQDARTSAYSPYGVGARFFILYILYRYFSIFAALIAPLEININRAKTID